jgi:hypothetical protein
MEVVVWFGERDAAQGSIIGEVAESFDLRDGKTTWCAEVISDLEIGPIDREHVIWGV